MAKLLRQAMSYLKIIMRCPLGSRTSQAHVFLLMVYSLQDISCDAVLNELRKVKKVEAAKIVEKLGVCLKEDLLERAVEKRQQENHWDDFCNIFLVPKLRKAVIPWIYNIVLLLQCSTSLRLVKVVQCEVFDPSIIKILPKTVETVLFDLGMAQKGQECPSWLPQAENMLKSMLKTKQISTRHNEILSLTEVDMESVSASSSDLRVIIENSPGLKYLKHYQMVKALYDLHVKDWKSGLELPKYKLKNLDVDFSHVIRCRMSPEWLLPPNALQCVTLLCPEATMIRIRFDCSTPNDVLTPLLNLERVNHFSAVCVSSGERSNLDFSDMSSVLEKFGEKSLKFLELKVIEEVEVHVIISACTFLETLTLSGCGYVTPPTCPSFGCHGYAPGTFQKLQHLFFADGDDFSWDHGAPECFWRAALLPSDESSSSRLKGLFLEFPRIPDPLTAEIFRRTKEDSEQLPFPHLEVASFCRYAELTVPDVISLCGLQRKANPPLRFLRISEGELWEHSNEKTLRNWFKQNGMECEISVDGSPPSAEEEKRYTFKIGRGAR